MEVEVVAGAVSVAGHLTIRVPERNCCLRARQRKQPVQRAQHFRRRCPQRCRLRKPAVRSPHPEEENRTNVFNIELLARRLVEVAEWLRIGPTGLVADRLRRGQRGAGAALPVAADTRVNVLAVVSRGGRPDLAVEWLAKVDVPTLLIVGGRDELVRELNRQAQKAIPAGCRAALFRVPPTCSRNPALSRRSRRWRGDWFFLHLTS